MHKDALIRQQHLDVARQLLPTPPMPRTQCQSPYLPVTSRHHLFSPLLYQKKQGRRPRLGATSTPTPRDTSPHAPMHHRLLSPRGERTPSHARPPPLLRRPLQSAAVSPCPTHAIRPIQAVAVSQPRLTHRDQPKDQVTQVPGAERGARGLMSGGK